MTTPTSVSYSLPTGWTARKVAAQFAKEWLPPFMAETDPRAPRWVLQSVMETHSTDAVPLWEAGISTEEYEERLDNADISWVIRASVARGRSKGTVLARVDTDPSRPNAILLTVFDVQVPQTLFDTEKLEGFLQSHDAEGMTGLFTGVIRDAGFEPLPAPSR